MKNAVLSALLVLVVAGTPVSAQEESKWTGFFGSNALSQYFGTNSSTFYDGPVSQSFFTLTRGKCSIDLWFSQGVDNSDRWENFDDEVDLSGWCNSTVGKFDYSVGLALYALPDLAGGNIIRPHFEIGRAFQLNDTYGLRPYLRAEIYESDASTGPKAGQQYRVGLGHSISLHDRVVLGFSTEVVYDTGAFGFESGTIWWSNGQLSWTVSPKLTLNLPVFKCGGGLSVDDRPSDCSVGVGVGIPVSFRR